MLHNVIIANEAMEEAKRTQKPCMVFKVDYEKAYDSVSWNFLLYMLLRLGFCLKWIQWIEGCLKFAFVSVLMNGSPSAEFIPQRGLRQGDPLASLLFNIVAEALTGLMRKAITRIYSVDSQWGKTMWKSASYNMLMILYFLVRHQWKMSSNQSHSEEL